MSALKLAGCDEASNGAPASAAPWPNGTPDPKHGPGAYTSGMPLGTRTTTVPAILTHGIRTALDRVSAGVTLIDTNGSIIYLNDFASRQTRVDAATEPRAKARYGWR